MLFIHGVGHFHPENVITNAFLEELDIGTNDQWIMDRVGIRERRTTMDLDYIRQTKNKDPRAALEASRYSNADMAAKAASMAMRRADIQPNQIGLVIGGGCTPEVLIPAEACRAAAQLGISVPAYDINAACSSFAAQIHTVMQMDKDVLPEYILILNQESFTKRIDYSDKKTAVLFGDCAAATIVSKKIPSRAKITMGHFGSDPLGWNKVVIPGLGHFAQEGSAVQGFAVRRTLAVLDDLLGEDKGDRQEIKFIGHQANLTMLESVLKRSGFDSKNHLFNIPNYGNCGAAGAPSVLSENWEKFNIGERVAVAVVGSGLAWGGINIQF